MLHFSFDLCNDEYLILLLTNKHFLFICKYLLADRGVTLTVALKRARRPLNRVGIECANTRISTSDYVIYFTLLSQSIIN